MSQSSSEYRPWDREAKLGDPPWKGDDPAVQAWEAAHGHDVRLKCYPELGCQLVVPALERELELLRAAVCEVVRLNDTPDGATGDVESNVGWEAADALRRALLPSRWITHGRHCTCSACAREDWTSADLAPCGMHGSDCPALYDPWGLAGTALPLSRDRETRL